MGYIRHCKRERDARNLSRILAYYFTPQNLESEAWALSQSSALEFEVVGTMRSHYCLQVVG